MFLPTRPAPRAPPGTIPRADASPDRWAKVDFGVIPIPPCRQGSEVVRAEDSSEASARDLRGALSLRARLARRLRGRARSAVGPEEASRRAGASRRTGS